MGKNKQKSAAEQKKYATTYTKKELAGYLTGLAGL